MIWQYKDYVNKYNNLKINAVYKLEKQHKLPEKETSIDEGSKNNKNKTNKKPLIDNSMMIPEGKGMGEGRRR